MQKVKSLLMLVFAAIALCTGLFFTAKSVFQAQTSFVAELMFCLSLIEFVFLLMVCVTIKDIWSKT